MRRVLLLECYACAQTLALRYDYLNGRFGRLRLSAWACRLALM